MSNLINNRVRRGNEPPRGPAEPRRTNGRFSIDASVPAITIIRRADRIVIAGTASRVHGLVFVLSCTRASNSTGNHRLPRSKIYPEQRIRVPIDECNETRDPSEVPLLFVGRGESKRVIIKIDAALRPGIELNWERARNRGLKFNRSRSPGRTVSFRGFGSRKLPQDLKRWLP